MALVDVVFFLLVFALLIGRMDATSPFNVIPPVAATGADLPAGGMTISVSESGELALAGNTVDRATLVEKALKTMTDDPKARIRINSDGATPLRHILPLIEDLREIEASEVVLVVTPNR